MIGEIVIVLALIVGLEFIYKLFISLSADVSKEYLYQQSYVDSIRKNNESAIHRSNKLMNSEGPRVGLDIIYGHYKTRHGNLKDIWEVLVKGQASQPSKFCSIGDETVSYYKLNARVQQFAKYLGLGTSRVAIPSNLVFESTDMLALMVACFILQVTLVLYDTEIPRSKIEADLYVQRGHAGSENEELSLLNSINEGNPFAYILKDALDEEKDFENKYTVENDRGIAIEYHRIVRGAITTYTKYTQLNLVSSAASAIKHLPLDHELTSNDVFLIFHSKSTEETVMSDIVKILCCFITCCDLVISKNENWADLENSNASIISMPLSDFQKLNPTGNSVLHRSIFSRLKLTLYESLLSHGVFRASSSNNLRLVYLQKSISSSGVMDLNSLNKHRANLGSRIIVECTYPGIAGPVILNDFYDYRVVDVKDYVSFGCIAQSIEMKLCDMKGNIGNIYVRGYNIGKTLKAREMENKDSHNDGFMPLSNVRGAWASDGCLYVYK